jgi:DNA-binding NtrC family response regulator
VSERYRIENALVGESAVMVALREQVRQLAATDMPVLIEGPTGSGKELVAQALHALSGRPGSFVGVNMCAMPDTRFEADFFGHTRGAFTGATSAHAGYFREAARGTLFLDEIGSTPISSQPKLLRVIQERRFRSVGSEHEERTDARLVAASNGDLRAQGAAGTFRSDLLYRLAVGVIIVPPLSVRLSDLRALVETLDGSTRGRLADRFTDCAWDALYNHSWPGNVRELMAVLHRCGLLPWDSRIDASAVRSALALSDRDSSLVARASEAALLLQVLADLDWDIDAAARRLSVTRSTLYRWMARLGVERPASRARRLREGAREMRA